MTRHHSNNGKDRRLVVPVAVAALLCVVALAFVILTVKNQTDRYNVGGKKTDPIDEAQLVQEEVQSVAESSPFTTVVSDKELITQEDAKNYAKIATRDANAHLPEKASELEGYNMLTNWMVPYRSKIRLPALKNMTVEQIAPIKVVVFHDGDLWVVDLGDITDLEKFDSATGTLRFRLPFSVMAFALFEPKYNG